jgi:chromate transport protein ChrA
MTAYLLTDHVLNFLLPAAAVALLLVMLARVFSRFLMSKKPVSQSLSAQAAIIFIVNVFVLAAGLSFLGNDGKMATYAAMVVTSSVCQWVLWRGWRV